MIARFIATPGVVYFCASVFVCAAPAQENINHASVSGRGTDPPGAVVPGAVVSARHLETNVTSESVTEGDGRFRFPSLRVGPYEIKVELAGFKDLVRQLTLSVGSAFELPLTLAVADVDARVTVTAEA